MKKALVHEWYYVCAGSEKCVKSFLNIWDDFDLFALIDFLSPEDRLEYIKGKSVNTSFVQHLPFAKSNYRSMLPLFPLAIEQFDLSEYDLILSNTHAVAKGVLTRPDQLHISYCHSPIRYAWDLYHQYLRESGLDSGLKGALAKYFLHKIRIWDQSTRNRVDYFLANSKYTAARIKKIYEKDATVIYPPVEVNRFPLNESKDSFYLTASRFVPYKKIDLIVEAFSTMPDKKLVVIGDGPDKEKIKAKAKSNIEFTGYVSDEEMTNLFRKAKAFVFAAVEDFGIVVVEAQAAGTPVIALNKAGTAETVIDGFNGVHFSEQSVPSIAGAVKRFDSIADSLSPSEISKYAQQFSRELYEQNIKNYIDAKSDEFFSKRV